MPISEVRSLQQHRRPVSAAHPGCLLLPQFGDVFCLRLLGQRMVFVFDPAMLSLFFKAPESSISFKYVLSMPGGGSGCGSCKGRPKCPGGNHLSMLQCVTCTCNCVARSRV